jgi:excisionase family DNA binding protein
MEYKLALSPAEAAEALGVSRSTVYRMISSGQLLVVKVGRRTLVAKSALVALLQTGGDVS